ncbi:M28 family peptidase [Lacinutrix jangbogonensis]|uniref:M28 family peptidase n=1 Tax=Lacinutrix jangbogonensis TaxID=1469557 RepID=UPI00053E546A|nr:M28 family peptidase [Lacinutrix jangbogonensis]
MVKKQIFILVVSILFIACNTTKISAQTQSSSTENTDYFNLVSNEFTGDLAYQTTAFVEKYWRVVGNKGFDASIYEIEKQLKNAGYINENNATPETIFTYRIEKRELKNPTWEPVSAIVKIEGEDKPLLHQETNRNMVMLNSYSTPKEGVNAEVVFVKDITKLKDIDVKGKIVFAEANPFRVYNSALVKGEAIGMMTYDNPKYLQPEKNTTSIQFRSMPLNTELKPWAIALSYEAKERLKLALKKGKVNLNVAIETKIYPSEELTIVAEIKGLKKPKERLVFSAHVQEPGANDNATGVGVALEMATVTAKLIKEGQWSNNRTLTFLWGDEIVSTKRYVEEDKIRAKDIKWGISLDMVGENTDITGGTFLIEKMPDPSAIWTRGNDKHTEWGGRKMSLNQMKPHYLNDFLITIFQEQGKRANWIVKTNPYEGGSDHVPFLRGNIPSVLFWHFTDQFYHTDNDRLDKVSKTTLRNVGTAALVSAYTLLNADENLAKGTLMQIESAAIERLNEELKQGKIALANGEDLKTQIEILEAWKDWYNKALETTKDMVEEHSTIADAILKSQNKIKAITTQNITRLSN